jgi:hypothetical protein
LDAVSNDQEHTKSSVGLWKLLQSANNVDAAVGPTEHPTLEVQHRRHERVHVFTCDYDVFVGIKQGIRSAVSQNFLAEGLKSLGERAS